MDDGADPSLVILTVTGHRPNRLGGYHPDAAARLLALATDTLEAMAPHHVFTGMALGWDMACAQGCVTLGIPFTACLPGAPRPSWPTSSRNVYEQLLRAAAKVEPLYAGYEHRNRFMADRCDWGLALWSGEPSGTGRCVAMMGDRDVPVWNVWKEWNDGR